MPESLFRKCVQAYVVAASYADLADRKPPEDRNPDDIPKTLSAPLDDVEKAMYAMSSFLPVYTSFPKYLRPLERSVVRRISGLPLPMVPMLSALSGPVIDGHARKVAYYSSLPPNPSEYNASDVFAAVLMSYISEQAKGVGVSTIIDFSSIRNLVPLPDEDIESIMESFEVLSPCFPYAPSTFNDTHALVVSAPKSLAIEDFARCAALVAPNSDTVIAASIVHALDPDTYPVSEDTWDKVEPECRQRVDVLTTKKE